MLGKMAPGTYLEFMKGWFGVNLENGKEATRALVLADVEKTPPEVVRASYLGLAAFKPVPALRSFKGPMLTVVLPGSDRPSSYQNLVPSLPAIKVKDLSHWLMMDDPEGFNAILDGFLIRARLAGGWDAESFPYGFFGTAGFAAGTLLLTFGAAFLWERCREDGGILVDRALTSSGEGFTRMVPAPSLSMRSR